MGRRSLFAVGRLAEVERLFVLWHRFRARKCDRQQLQRQLVALQARLGRLLRRGRENPYRQAAALCRELTKWWAALWTLARVDGVEPTNNVAERALRPAVLRRQASFGSDSAAIDVQKTFWRGSARGPLLAHWWSLHTARRCQQ